MANNEEMLHDLNTKVNLLNKRIELLEETIAKLNRDNRADTMHTLGVAMLKMGEQLVNVSNSNKKFTVKPIGSDETANDQTFYATFLNNEAWHFATMTDGELAPFDMNTVVPGMRDAVNDFITSLPAGTEGVAFNVYRG